MPEQNSEVVFDPLKFEKDQFGIVISNVEFALDPENYHSLDMDDCESIVELLKELYEKRYGETYKGEPD